MPEKLKDVTEAEVKAEINKKQLMSLDFGAKFLLKDKSDFDIIEGFLSPFLTQAGHPPVRIKGFLDPESNKENSEQKRSAADVMLEGFRDEIYIMEFQRLTSYQVHRKCAFSTARSMIDSLSLGTEFSQLKKVFHLSFLSFVPEYMESVILHQKSIYTYPYLDDEKRVQLRESKYQSTRKDVDIFPESFLISAPLFDGIIKDDKRHLGEVLYFLKESEIRDDFTAPFMKKLKKRLDFAHLSPNEQKEYIQFMINRKTDEYIVNDAKERAKEENKREVAMNLLQCSVPIEIIVKSTGLSAREIEQLNKNIRKM